MAGSYGSSIISSLLLLLLSQPCLTLCDPIDSSPPGSPVPGSLQARTLEWAAISFSNAWKWKVKVNSLSHVRLSATAWTADHQAPLSMGFSRQEHWSGVPLPSLRVPWGASILFSIVAAPTCIPSNSRGGVPFLHTLTHSCDLLSFG